MLEDKIDIMINLISMGYYVSGIIISITLTVFTFLVTRNRPSKPEHSELKTEYKTSRDHKIMGPFCLLYSFFMGLISFSSLAIMNRITNDLIFKNNWPFNEFYHWLSPVHFGLIVLIISILFLTYGIYYVTRTWLLGDDMEDTPILNKKVILNIAHAFAAAAPILLYVFITTSISLLWWEFLGFWTKIILIISLTPFFFFIRAIGKFIISKVNNLIGFFFTIFKVILIMVIIQMAQNFLWYEMGNLIPELEFSMVLIRSIGITIISLTMVELIKQDIESLEKKFQNGD